MKKVFAVAAAAIALLAVALCAVPALAQGFSDGFEGGALDPWWAVYPFNTTSPVLSTDYAHSGSQSLKLSNSPGAQAWCVLQRTFSSLQSGRLSVWFYDTAPGSETRYAGLFGSRGGSQVFYLGILDWKAYEYCVSANVGTTEGASPSPRTQGWHHLECLATENSFEGYFDGAHVLSHAADQRFDYIDLDVFGPGWRPAGTYYFDDFSYTPVPEPSSIVFLGSGILALAGMIRRRKPS